MKFNQIFSASLLTAALFFAACGTTPPNPDQPGKPGTPTDTTQTNPGTEVTAITCAEAAALAEGTEVKVVGYVITPFDMADSKDGASKEQSAWLADDASASKGVIQAYYLTVTEAVAKGDKVECTGKIKYYKKGDDTTVEIVKPGTMTVVEKGGNTGGGNTNPGETLGTEEAPLSVAEAIAKASPGNYAYVKGYIIGSVKGQSVAATDFTVDNAVATNIIIADNAAETDPAKAMPIQLPAGAVRSALNLVDKAGNLGKEVLLYGTLENYFKQPGIKNVSYAVLGDSQIGDTPGAKESEGGAVSVADFLKAKESNLVWYELTGEITDEGCDGETYKFNLEQYGDFMLKDATGSIYVYGIAPAKGGKFDTNMGLKKGDNITLMGLRSSYGGNPQVKSAYLVKKN